MVQLKCPSCGFVQNISEEKFISIEDDHVICPHCSENVPKETRQINGDSIPDEAKTKISAFSKRILTGREVTREILQALESQVRLYGMTPESSKALGIGYTYAGDKIKAEEFLIQALDDRPKDREILSCLLDVFVSERRFDEAVRVGENLLGFHPNALHEDDLAALATAYLETDRPDSAERLIDSTVGAKSANPGIRRIRKRLKKGKAKSFFSFFESAGKTFRRAAARKVDDGVEDDRPLMQSENKAAPVKQDQRVSSIMEYWIYSKREQVPQWEDLQNRLMEVSPSKADREKIMQSLETEIKRSRFTMDYIMRTEAPELFSYPEELIPQHSKDFSPEDLNVLNNAHIIVRVRLTLDRRPDDNQLALIVNFVEAAHRVTNGVIQDAISHTLWGTKAWKKCVENHLENVAENHLLFEALEEEGLVWMHTHGMSKFGRPELEFESIKADSAAFARKLLSKLAEALIRMKREPDYSEPLIIPGMPVSFKLELRPKDEEGHFPVGSLKVTPVAQDSRRTVSASPPAVSHVDEGRRSEPSLPERQSLNNEQLAFLRDKLISAHNRAKENLILFKNSFLERKHTGLVYAAKIGFPTPDGNYEWMWIVIDSWRVNVVTGYLENVPVLRKDLFKGSRVTVSESEIFDWAILKSGSIVRGAYTENISIPQQGENLILGETHSLA